jgi:hypothetical protein
MEQGDAAGAGHGQDDPECQIIPDRPRKENEEKGGHVQKGIPPSTADSYLPVRKPDDNGQWQKQCGHRDFRTSQSGQTKKRPGGSQAPSTAPLQEFDDLQYSKSQERNAKAFRHQHRGPME